LREAGIVKDPPTARDLNLRTVMAIAGVFEFLQPWWPQPGLREQSLGTVLKRVPPETAQHVETLLRWARLEK
jgi:hypothetical protein